MPTRARSPGQRPTATKLDRRTGKIAPTVISFPTRPTNERTIAHQFRARDATYSGKLRDAADLYRAAITEDGTVRGLVDTIAHGIFGLPLSLQGRPDMCSALLEADGTPSEYAAMLPENEAAAVFTDGIVFGIGLGQLVEPRTPRPIGVNHCPRMRWWDPRFLWQEPYSRQWHLDTQDGTIDITPGDGEWCMFCPYPETDAWRHGLWLFVTLGFIFTRDVTFDEVRHSEVLAPTRVARAQKATSPQAREKMFAELKQMARDNQFVLPEQWLYEIVESTGNILNVYQDIRQWAREQTEIGITGNTVMVGGGAGSGMVNLSIFERVTASKRRRYAGAWCDFVRDNVLAWWGQDNYGDRNVPKPVYDTESPEDSMARAKKIGTWGEELGKAAKGLKSVGLRMQPASVTEQLQRAGIRTEPIPNAGAQRFDLDPGDEIAGITIAEWREDQGLPALGDERDKMMMAAGVKAGGQSTPAGAAPPGAVPASPAAPPPPPAAPAPPTARIEDDELDDQEDDDELGRRQALAAGLAGSRTCEHGRTHVCERCGVRRVYGVPVAGPNGPTFPISWRPLTRQRARQGGPLALDAALRLVDRADAALAALGSYDDESDEVAEAPERARLAAARARLALAGALDAQADKLEARRGPPEVVELLRARAEQLRGPDGRFISEGGPKPKTHDHEGRPIVAGAGSRDGLGRSKAAQAARNQTKAAKAASEKAKTGGSHADAAQAHRDAAAQHREAAARSARADYKAAHEAAAKAHEDAAAAHAAEHAKAPASIAPSAHERFARDVAGQKLEGVREFGKGNGEAAGIHPILTGRLGGHDVFVKPAHSAGMSFDPKKAVELHSAVAESARRMGVEHMVMPAAVHNEAPKFEDHEHAGLGKTSFVTKSAGPGFGTVSANQKRWEKISEHDRVAGALIDHLHSNGDRHSQNALVNEHGALVLIDHDYTHGKGGRYNSQSIFFRGGSLAMREPQAKFSDLPPRMREYVSELARSTDEQLATAGIPRGSFGRIRSRARYIETHGLEASIDKYGGRPRGRLG